MIYSEFSIKSKEETLKELSTTINGLSTEDALKRQKTYGPNTLTGKELKWYHVLIRQFKSPFLYLLIGASLLSLVLGQFLDGMMILLFVAINTSLGFLQEYRSEKTVKLLKQFVSSKVKVVRNGKEEALSSNMLVPGDLIVVKTGDVIPADIRFIQTQNISVDESVLTGESIATLKSSQKLPDAPKDAYKAKNIGFSGTNVVYGEALGIVVATGKNTQIGKIAGLAMDTKRESSFEKGISKLSSFILNVIIATLVFIVILNLLIKGFYIEIPTLLIFSIALAISVIPEALPVVITFSFSRGALHLARNKVVVKRLSSIEDLGSIEVLCTDKTGTITQNQLTIDKFYPGKDNILYTSALASPLSPTNDTLTDPFDIAIVRELPGEDRAKIKKCAIIKEIPFDPRRKRNTMLVNVSGRKELVSRGAFESIFKLCKKDTVKSHDYQKWIKDQGREGKRVLAVAKKIIPKDDTENLESLEKNMNFVGLISFTDPLKSTSSAAIKQAGKLGVHVKILTGDSREVAGAIAHSVGLIDDPQNVITGEELESIHPAKQHEIVEEYSVFARVSPEQKHNIIKLLQAKHEVGFLGEGINDAPALKTANVAIAVEGASDIAREASDIVLLNKSLHHIVDGIREGRAIFGNTAKYIKATLASNFGNFYTVAIASLFINYLPLLPLQILLLNLLTDFPMIAVVTDNVDEDDLKRPRNYDIKEIALFSTVMGVVSSFFDFLFFVLFYKISPQVLQTNWFIGSVVTELVFLFSVRTRLPLLKAVPPSLPLVLLSLAALLVGVILPFTEIGHAVFSFETPILTYILMIIAVTISYFVTTEIVKNMYYKFVYQRTQSGS